MIKHFIQCQCGAEILGIEQVKDQIYLEKFYWGSQNHNPSFKKRIKDAWTMIVRPIYFMLDDVILSPEDSIKLGKILVKIGNNSLKMRKKEE